MNHLRKIAPNKIIALIQMWCKFWSCITAKLCNRSHLQWDLPVCKNMALPFHPQLLQFKPRGKCVGWGGQLAWLSDVCWCDVVCTTVDRSAVNQSQDYINLYEFGCNIFLMATLCECRYHLLCCGSLKSQLRSVVHGAQPDWNSAWQPVMWQAHSL